jgi:PAS domain S-box-containing protein
MLGEPFTRLLPARLEAASARWFGTGSLRLGAAEEFAGRRADGDEFPAEASIAPAAASGGTHFTVIMRDVTQKRRADEALAESRRLLQVAVETARLGFWHFDIATRAMTVSTEWKRQLGLESEELSTDPEVLIRLVHPDDVPSIRRARQDLESGRASSLELEFRARHREGGYRDIRASAVVHHDTSGMPVRIFGTNLDITSVRDAERTVRRLSAHILRLQDFERRRIARELHDTTAQNLAALNMNLAQLDRALSASDPAHARVIEETMSLADLAVQEIRTMSYILHPPMLDTLGLPRATQDYVEGFSTRSSIETSADIDDTMERLSEEAEIALFRVLQESLGNVHRHSGASHAHVRLSVEADSVELTINDDGHGMDPPTRERLRRRATVGVGITGMTERLEQLGGTLQILSSDEGTTVSAAIPLSRALRHPVQPVQDIPDSL